MHKNKLGYRAWIGEKTSKLLLPWVVAKSGMSLVWRRKWLRMLIMLAFLPIIFPCIGIFVYEYSITTPDMRRGAAWFAAGPFQRPDLAQLVMQSPDEARHEVWSSAILFFFRIPQLVTMVVLIGIVAPMLISYDLRSKAYLMYFSRPLTSREYIIGKSAVLWCYVGAITTLPALALYLLGVLLSPDLSVIYSTWDIPIRIFLATIALVVPTTALALCFAAHTSESRYATFTWFATWVIGFVSYNFLTYAVQVGGRRARPRRFRNGPPTAEELGIDVDRWNLVSPYHAIGKVQSWLFGVERGPGSVWPCLIMLVFITVGCWWLIRRRILARLSV